MDRSGEDVAAKRFVGDTPLSAGWESRIALALTGRGVVQADAIPGPCAIEIGFPTCDRRRVRGVNDC
jgi:hypothetical protein